MRHLARALVLLSCWAAVAAADQPAFSGRPLEDALRLLQRAGLPIVFSSEVVKPDMRVPAEPHSRSPRQQLDELLRPHGLRAEAGPGKVILIVRNPTAVRDRVQHQRSVEPPATQPVTSPLHPARYTDDVIVWGSGHQPMDIGGSQTTFDGPSLRWTTSVLTGDGLDAARSMPRVVTTDDYRADFSVRGSPSRQVGIVIDGVATPWLQHTVYGRSDAGSLSMFSSDVLDQVTLQTGAY